MGYFRAAPYVLQAQREDLETAYRSLCQEVSEIGGVIRRLDSMSSFGGPIGALRRIQRTSSEQQIKLRQNAGVLGGTAELYTSTERKNLDGSEPWTGAFRSLKTDELAEPAWTLREMIPNARSYFGMNIIIRQRD